MTAAKVKETEELDEALTSDALPEGWAWAKLGDLVRPSAEKVEPKECPGSPYLSLEHVEPNTTKILGHGFAREVKSTKTVFKAGDVLYGKLRPYLNKVCLPNFDGICSTDFLVFKRTQVVDSRLLVCFFSQPSVVEIANHHSTGVELPRVNFHVLSQLPFGLPPVGEQKRIVAKVEELLAEVNKVRSRLEKVSKILKVFRQSVLAAACSGHLTEDWRANNSGDESAVERVAKILSRRKRVIAEGRRSPYKEPYAPETSLLSEVPEEWATTSIDALTTHITSGSRGWKQYYRDDGPGTFVMAQNVKPLQFDISYRLGVAPPAGDRDRQRSEIKKGDILVTIVGANTGDVCRVPESVQQYYVCQSVALLRPVLEGTSNFLELYLNSPQHGLAQFRSWIYGEGRPHLSLDHLRATVVAIPSLSEQREIVRRVEALFKLADAIEKRVGAATKRADKLTQAILATAFRGELVPTEAELAGREGRLYEPASALLDRIKAEREKASASKNNAGRRPGGKRSATRR